MIPKKLLNKPIRILFLTHLAIGDFTYLQNCFCAFKKAYPHIKMDLWIDEVRRTRLFWEWKHLCNYSLIDWVHKSGIFDTIYAKTYSWGRFKKHLKQVRELDYPIVVSLCIIRPHLYAQYARKMSPRGLVAGIVDAKHKHRKDFDVLDFRVEMDLLKNKKHVSHIYRDWFEKLFDMEIADSQMEPFVSIPKEWLSYAKLQFIKWGIKTETEDKVVFINSFAKSVSRCWPFDKVVKLIMSLKNKEEFRNAYFIINVEPKFFQDSKIFLSNFNLDKVLLFTADKNFFQLPAIISLCDFVISVETSVIHLASAFKIPVLALMRQKNPEWRPFHEDSSRVIYVPKRNSWIEDISVEKIVKEVEAF